MRIKEEDYILTPAGEGDTTFHLQLLTPVLDKKNGVTSMKMKEVAYNVPLSRAVIMIIQNRVENRLGDSDVDLAKYVEIHREECRRICKALKVRFKI